MNLPFAMSVEAAGFMAFACLIAAFVRGYSGFGFSALVVSAAALVMNPVHMVGVVMICEFLMTFQQWRGVRADVDWRRVLALMIGAVIGLPIGLWGITRVGVDTARAVIGVYVLAMCAVMWLGWRIRSKQRFAPHLGVGVFAGMYNATYYQRHVQHRPDLIEKLGEFQVMLANEKDYIATRVAHKLNLTGPAISVHTACSTSLVAVAQAVQALRAGQCEMALAGGVSITCPPRSGYLYQEGAMLSPDGKTRSFDAAAQGTVFSDGAAVVLLKRLHDAQAQGDQILAVIRGVAVNNDGGNKASFTAPAVDGQAAVIRAALRDAIFSTSEVVGVHGVYSFKPGALYGVDQRARVIVKLDNGQWKLAL